MRVYRMRPVQNLFMTTRIAGTMSRNRRDCRRSADRPYMIMPSGANFMCESEPVGIPLDSGGSLVSRGNYFHCQLGAYIGRQLDMNPVRAQRSDFVERLDQPLVHIDTQLFFELLGNLFVCYFAVELA